MNEASVTVEIVRGAPDHWRVNLAEDWEILLWTQQLGCTADELREAVSYVGPGAGAVRKYLATRHPGRD